MEGGNKGQYNSPYINNDNNNSSIEEVMSNMTINEEKDKEAKNPYKIESKDTKEEKKWVEKEEEKKEEKKQQINYEDPEVQKTLPLWLQKSPGEENQITPLWKRKLAELESPFINDTIKGIVADAIHANIIDAIKNTSKELNKENEKFIFFLYGGAFLDTKRYIGLVNGCFGSANHGTGQVFAYLNHCINLGNIEWYKSSNPFQYLLDSKLSNNVPSNNNELSVAIQNLNAIFKECAIEMISKFDPKMTKLNGCIMFASDPKARNDLKSIKPNFVEAISLAEKENQRYRETISNVGFSI